MTGTGTPSALTLPQLLRRNLIERPTRTALSDKSGSLTHAELWQAVRHCAGQLKTLGVQENDTVLLMLDNSIEYFVILAALSFLGARPIPTNTAYKGNILRHVLVDARCPIAVVEHHYLKTIQQEPGDFLNTIVVRTAIGDESDDISSPVAVVTLSDISNSEPVDPIETGVWDTLAIVYTSGTTGTSKGVTLSHANAYVLAYAPHVQSERTEDDMFLVACPMFHNLGLMGAVYAAIVVGGSAYVLEHFSASQFWNDVDKAGATCTILVGTMCDFLMQQPAQPDDRFHPLRTAHVIPVPPYRDEMEKRFNMRLTTAFGSTETGAFITNVTPTRTPITSVGKVRPGWTIRLVDDHDMEVEDGSAGEAIVRSEAPWVMTTGYLNNPEATAALWRNGWLHTGDILRRDADGWFYFVDRVNHSVRRRGENISSAEVERELLTHPDVLECAVMGVGPRTDQEVKAAVKRREGSKLSESDLVRFAIETMPYYAVPRYVVFVDDFPRTATGKIRKVEMATLEPGTWDREAAGIQIKRPRAATERA